MLRVKSQKLYRSNYFPFIILTIGMLAIHMLLPMQSGDDNVYSNVLKDSSLSDFLIWRYFNWSSRLIIEAILVLLLQLPLFIWRLLDTGIIVLLGFAISKIIGSENNRQNNWLISILLFAYPLIDMNTAGWVATTTNYLWVLAFGVMSIVTVKKIITGQKVKVSEYLISTLALIFSVNQEQMCMVLFAVFLIAVIYSISRKRHNWLIYLGLIICIASSVLIMTCPGNIGRTRHEIAKFFPDYGNLTVVDKIEIGASSTLSHFIFEPNIIFILFCFLIYFSVKQKYTDKLYRLFALLPLLFSLLFVFIKISPDLFPGIGEMVSQMTQHGLITLENFTKPTSYIAPFILYRSFCLILISIYLINGNTWVSFICFGVALLDLLSRIAVAFSPTIWASDTRTYIFMYAAIIICGVMIFQSSLKNFSSRFVNTFLVCAGFAAGISCLDLLIKF